MKTHDKIQTLLKKSKEKQRHPWFTTWAGSLRATENKSATFGPGISTTVYACGNPWLTGTPPPSHTTTPTHTISPGVHDQQLAKDSEIHAFELSHKRTNQNTQWQLGKLPQERGKAEKTRCSSQRIPRARTSTQRKCNGANQRTYTKMNIKMNRKESRSRYSGG